MYLHNIWTQLASKGMDKYLTSQIGHDILVFDNC